jgi:hypothetical protein
MWPDDLEGLKCFDTNLNPPSNPRFPKSSRDYHSYSYPSAFLHRIPDRISTATSATPKGENQGDAENANDRDHRDRTGYQGTPKGLPFRELGIRGRNHRRWVIQ